jgi:light-regulated signal transduction histidine kinase (bacteriophytochrome)
MEEALVTALKDLRTSIQESEALVTHETLPSIMAEKSQMIMLLQNLIGNAIKYRDVASPRIHVSVERKGKEWIFSVKDDGIGIPKDSQDRIFQMFQRLHSRQEYEGTGIGLAICRRIVERHGGRIWVESEEGKGSTFFFTIPR